MKKTFSISISGRIFMVEEDAYALLLDYLQSLSQVFHGADGNEIVNDIESRISELFQEQADSGKQVFTIDDVNAIISTIGDAAQLADTSEEVLAQENECANATHTEQTANADCTIPPPLPYAPKKFYRSITDSVLGGVFGGIAAYTGISALPLRLIFVILGFATGFFPLFVIYCILWACIPSANTLARQLEQEGKPVTIDNIGIMAGKNASIKLEHESGVMKILKILGTLFMGFFGLMAAMVGLCVGIGLIILTTFTIIFAIGGISSLPSFMAMGGAQRLSEFADPIGVLIVCICLCLAVLIPCIAMIWAACSVLFKTKGASTTTWVTAIILEITAIIVCSILIPLNF